MSQENGRIVRIWVGVMIAASLAVVTIFGLPWDKPTTPPTASPTTPTNAVNERTSLVPNPSFERGTEGWRSDGVSPIERLDAGPDNPNVRTGVYYGYYYYEMDVAPRAFIGGTNNATDYIPAVAGKTYSMSVKLGTENQVVAHMTFCDADGAQIKTYPLTIPPSEGAIVKWENKLAPLNTAMIVFQIYQDSAADKANVAFDGLVVTETTAG